MASGRFCGVTLRVAPPSISVRFYGVTAEAFMSSASCKMQRGSQQREEAPNKHTRVFLSSKLKRFDGNQQIS